MMLMIMMDGGLQDEGSDWVEAGPLPIPTYGLAVVTLGTRLLATGEQMTRVCMISNVFLFQEAGLARRIWTLSSSLTSPASSGARWAG